MVGLTLLIQGKKIIKPKKNMHSTYENSLHFKKEEDISTKNAKEK